MPSATLLRRGVVRALILCAGTHVAGAGRAADAPAPVVALAIAGDRVYGWTVDSPPENTKYSPDVSTTLATATVGPAGEAATWRRLPVHIMLHTWEDTKRHRFPLRWATGDDGLRTVAFYCGAPSTRYVPNSAKGVRIKKQLLSNGGAKPVPADEPEFGLHVQEGEMFISASGEPPLMVNLQPAFDAIYRGDPAADLVTLQNARDERPPFTFDIAYDGPAGAWTLYVQRAPKKAIDMVTYYPSREKDKRLGRIERFAVPFAEPFFAHRAAAGPVYFVTETTGSVVVARPPPAGQREWSSKTVWSGADRPVRLFVRDGPDRAYALTDEEMIPLAGDAKPVKHKAGPFRMKTTEEMNKALEAATRLAKAAR